MPRTHTAWATGKANALYIHLLYSREGVYTTNTAITNRVADCAASTAIVQQRNKKRQYMQAIDTEGRQ